MFSIGNEELEALPVLGKTIECPHCGEVHDVQYGKGSDGRETNAIAFYKCGEVLYLCGIGGRNVMSMFEKGGG